MGLCHGQSRDPVQQGTEQASVGPLSTVAPSVQDPCRHPSGSMQTEQQGDPQGVIKTEQHGDPGHVLSPAVNLVLYASALPSPCVLQGLWPGDCK